MNLVWKLGREIYFICTEFIMTRCYDSTQWQKANNLLYRILTDSIADKQWH